MKEISFELLKPKTGYFRLDCIPFLTIYPIGMLYVLFTLSPKWICQGLPIFTLLIQGIIFLVCAWSVNFKSKVQFSTTSSISEATHVLVNKHFRKESRNRAAICKIQRKQDSAKTIFIDYYKQEYLFNPNTSKFEKQRVLEDMTFKQYIESKGIQSPDELQTRKSLYGTNTMVIPMPEFLELFKEHVVAPFFVFQIFCTVLWMLEDYWYFSMLTFFMLFVFESIVVISRRKNMERIRGMRIRHREMLVFRDKTWKTLMSDELVPGDIVCLQNKAKHEPDNRLPCDMLLLSGNCTVDESILTGESIPQIKEPIQIRDNLEEKFSLKSGLHKAHILWGRTEILQCIRDPEKAFGLSVLSPPPRQCCVAYVLRTGFHTTQGKLVRTVLFTAERVSVESKDAFIFLFVLLCFALLASVYTLYTGLNDPERDKYKVIIKSILILASVVPPELPMELSLAVNNSILSLISHAIYCTEPYRIPSAGRVTVCCFDKTGTLTSDKMIVNGVMDEQGKMWALSQLKENYQNAEFVLGLCHSIAFTENKTILGDPLERLAFEGVEWIYNAQKEKGQSKQGDYEGIILARYPFSSALKRMSVIVQIKNYNSRNSIIKRVLAKGAPEIMRPLLKNVPENYNSIVNSLTKEGSRVLCLAYKDIPEAVKLAREEAESDLTFCGFIVTSCPLKKDTKRRITELLESKHKIVIITGDNQYTAAFVAKELGICDTSKMIFIKKSAAYALEIVDSDNKFIKKTNSSSDIKEIIKGKPICIDGDALEFIDAESAWKDEEKCAIIGQIQVFARTSPSQKDLIVGVFNKLNEITLMCGDGTNDVGSLKRAHIGIALMNKEQTATEKAAMKENYRKAMMTDSVNSIGDACIAAPFSYKYDSIKCVVQILRQGRCTLVTTLQMYKILAINGLMLAYSLSVLYQLGLKTGDFQSAIFGVPIAVYFYLISRAKPLVKLQPYRPPTSIFELSQISSVIVQFVVHISGLIFLTNLAYKHTAPEDLIKPDGQFKPTVLNTVVFLYLTFVDATNFLINYQGEPFMESIWSNKILIRMLLVHMGVLLIAAFDMSEDLRWFLELHALPDAFPNWYLIGTMILDFGICYTVKLLIHKFKYGK